MPDELDDILKNAPQGEESDELAQMLAEAPEVAVRDRAMQVTPPGAITGGRDADDISDLKTFSTVDETINRANDDMAASLLLSREELTALDRRLAEEIKSPNETRGKALAQENVELFKVVGQGVADDNTRLKARQRARKMVDEERIAQAQRKTGRALDRATFGGATEQTSAVVAEVFSQGVQSLVNLGIGTANFVTQDPQIAAGLETLGVDREKTRLGPVDVSKAMEAGAVEALNAASRDMGGGEVAQASSQDGAEVLANMEGLAGITARTLNAGSGLIGELALGVPVIKGLTATGMSARAAGVAAFSLNSFLSTDGTTEERLKAAGHTGLMITAAGPVAKRLNAFMRNPKMTGVARAALAESVAFVVGKKMADVTFGHSIKFTEADLEAALLGAGLGAAGAFGERGNVKRVGEIVKTARERVAKLDKEIETIKAEEAAVAESAEPKQPKQKRELATAEELRAEENVPRGTSKPKDAEALGDTTVLEARVQAEREARGVDPVIKEARRKDPELMERAEAELAKDENAGGVLARDLAKNPRPRRDWETALLLIEKRSVKNAEAKAEEAIIKADKAGDGDAVKQAEVSLKDARERLDTIDQASILSGSESGRSLRSQQLLLGEDFSLRAMKRRRESINVGRELSPKQLEAQKAETQALHDRLSKAEKTMQGLQARALEAEARLAEAPKTPREVASRKPPPVKSKEYGARNKVFTREAHDQLKKDLQSRGFQAGINPAQLVKDLVKIGGFHAEAIGHKALDFTAWSKAMIEDMGVKVQPHLKAVWKEVQNNPRLEAEKARLRRETAKFKRKTEDQDFAPKAKKPPIKKDKELIAAEAEYHEARGAWIKALAKDELAKRTLVEKAKDTVFKEVPSVIKGTVASSDFSWLERQGFFQLMARPISTLKTARFGVRAMGSKAPEGATMWEKLFNRESPQQARAEAELRRLEYFDEAVANGLEITETQHSEKLRQEETFQGRLVNRIPLVAASGRSHTTGLNAIRLDVYGALRSAFGSKRAPTPAEGRLYANFANVTTGRPNVGRGKVAQFIAGMGPLAWAPRWAFSRGQVILGQPLWSGALSKKVGIKGTLKARSLIALEYGRALSGYAAVLAGFQKLGFETPLDPDSSTRDPNSTDFMKVLIPREDGGEPTRIDLFASISQLVVLGSRLSTGEVTTGSGDKVATTGPGSSKFHSPGKLIGNFLRNKAAPLPATGLDLLEGERFGEQTRTPQFVAKNLMVPLAFRDVYESMVAHGTPEDVSLGMLAIFGAGIQVRDKENNKASSKTRKRSTRKTRKKRR